jgi:hypothetical protein
MAVRKGYRWAGLGPAAALWLFGFGAGEAAAQGLIGQCADCHTMHNSQGGEPVARQFGKAAPDGTRNPNLLKFDCLACHAQDAAGPNVALLPGGSRVPQVYHGDSSDLAAGNFRHIVTGGDRKGHNVVDVVPADSTFTDPPGFRHFVADPNGPNILFDFDVTKFTCAGTMGCHGMRGQLLEAGDEFSGTDPVFRTGLTALSGYDGSGATTALFRGAHHANYDGLKTDGAHPNFYQNPLAHSYRFIRALKGYGNQTDRWRNVGAESHNEYAGGYVNTTLRDTNYETTTTCTRCHTGGQGGETSRLTVPNQTMTGFCITCHSSFHSSGATNGTSGAFLRHPSDYVIPNRGEYANYTSFDATAPVARPVEEFVGSFTQSPAVRPGTDMVMCLSCHVSHASPYDGMLRFDYAAQTSYMRAGYFPTVPEAQAAGGCLACHTTKGVLPQNR